MTKQEKLIVSAYTGVLMVEYAEFIEYAETLLGRPILAKETNSQELVIEIAKAVQDDFMKLCEDE